jgi:tRNA G18 (ribose-2'-O)-methylase SpoU
VQDEFRYWSHDAIREHLGARASLLVVGVENWARDPNIGSVVRTANAFNVRRVWIIGERRWNRRGAMSTDRYIDVERADGLDAVLSHPDNDGYEAIGIDNVPGSCPIETFTLPERCLMLFGSEGPGLSEAARERCTTMLAITQYGSTRSINAGAAAAIAMHAWVRQHRWGQLP